MTDHNHNSQAGAPKNSYVDDYAPPTSAFANSPWAKAPSTNSAAPAVQNSRPAPMQGSSTQAQSSSPVKSEQKISQSLEDQNIFHLLGLETATEEEKEGFLDELQQVIWEDFLENDVDLLLTEEELQDFKKISAKPGMEEEEKQGEMIEFLEKLIPDLEKIMLEKALELKEEMFRERISEFKDLYKNDQNLVKKVQHAEELLEDQQWRSAADELNAVLG